MSAHRGFRRFGRSPAVFFPGLLPRGRARDRGASVRSSLAEQIRGLRSGDFMAGFAHTADVGEGIVAEPIWHDPLLVAVPARHELLEHKAIPLHKLADHPLICAILTYVRDTGEN